MVVAGSNLDRRSLLVLAFGGLFAGGCASSPPPVAPAQAWAVDLPAPPDAGVAGPEAAPAPGPSEPHPLDAPIVPGVGVGPIEVGKTTAEEVGAWLGGESEETRHGDYSVETAYRRSGIATYVCQEDPEQRVFVIELTRPFEGKTPEGFSIGQTKLGEVIDEHGEGSWSGVGETYSMSYPGISYHVAPRDGSTSYEEYADSPLIEIDVELVSPGGGLAQCDEHPTW